MPKKTAAVRLKPGTERADKQSGFRWEWLTVKKYYGLCVATFFLWGSIYVFSKFAFQAFSPLTVLFLRNVVAIVPVWLAARKRGFRKVKREHIRYFLICGVLGYAVATGLVLKANDLLSAGAASLINAANPVFIILFAVVLLGERMTLRRGLGVGCALVGVVAVIGLELGAVSPAGIVFSVLGVILWALSSVILRKVSRLYPPEQVTLLCLAISLPVALAGALVETGGALPTVTLPAVASVLYIGVFGIALANLLWNRCLAVMDASLCSMFYPLQPVCSALLGILLLGEPVTVNFLLGGALICAGVVIGVGEKNVKR